MNTESSATTEQKLSDEAIIEIIDMHKWFGDFHVLQGINLTVHKQERIAICGPSGSGKSTLIRCINRLEEHQKGRIIVDGIELTNNIKNIEKVRMEVGMVFQHFNLFPHLTIIENLTLGPIWVRKVPKAEAEETAMYYLEKVQIPEQAKKYPGQLSGGQQQRVAIARALINDPEIILADEPTGNLDQAAGAQIMEIFRELHEAGSTIPRITHDPGLASQASRIVQIDDGCLSSQPGIPDPAHAGGPAPMSLDGLPVNSGLRHSTA